MLNCYFYCSLDDILHELRRSIKPTVVKLEVTRETVLEDVLKETRRVTFDPHNTVKVRLESLPFLVSISSPPSNCPPISHGMVHSYSIERKGGVGVISRTNGSILG